MADLPVIAFIQERLAEGDPTLETRKGTGFYDLFVKPQQFMLQPLVDGMETVLNAQSVRRIQALTEPDSFNQDLVSDLVSNVYVTRDQGDFATCVVRAFYTVPKDLEFPKFAAEFTDGNLNFFNSSDILVTKSQMALQQQGTLYYADIPVQAENQGSTYDLAIGSITTFVNDSDAVSVSNITAGVSGRPLETNTQLLARAKNSIGVRDLEVAKGINAILNENFPFLTQIQPIGFGDPEMMRDILYNVHVGSKTDIYLKTPSLQTQVFNAVGLAFDNTRQIHKNVHMELKANDFSLPDSYLGNAFIVSGSLSVKDDTVETAAQIITASIPAGTGSDFSGNQWIRMKVGKGNFVDIKIAGAVPATTQRFEVINAINSAVGIAVASANGVDRILIQSPSIGAESTLTLTPPISPRTDGTLNLIPSASAAGYNISPQADAIFSGNAAQVFIENIDFQVDYANGKIIQASAPLGSITSGRQIADNVQSGLGSVSVGSNIFQTPVSGAFANIHVGDEVVILVSTGAALGSYIVSDTPSDSSLKLLGLAPTANDASIQYKIISHQTVVIDYMYNPLSIDIGNQVLLADGISRGVRQGRDNYTIKNLAFIKIVSIEEIDPNTFQGTGTFLNAPSGFGEGGFGEGSFGISGGGDYSFVVNEPNHRFSAFEDSLIIFDPSFFGGSYAITYLSAPEIPAIHSFCRNDAERVMGADILPKNFLPGFVDIAIKIRIGLTNTTVGSDATLTQMVKDFVNNTPTGTGMNASDIIKLLEDAGVDSVQNPFDMTVTVNTPDGGYEVFSNQDVLAVDAIPLLRDTTNFTTPRIVHFYPGNITVSRT